MSARDAPGSAQIRNYKYRPGSRSRKRGRPRFTSSFPRRRESTATHIVIPPKAGIHGHPYRHSREGGNPRRGDTAMGSRLHGNDSGRRRTPHGRRRRTRIVIPATAAGGAPHIVIAATAGIHGGGTLRWVPVYTGTTVGGGAPHTVGDGGTHIVISRDGGRRRTPHRHSPDGGNPRRGETAMGSRLHGNDAGRRRTPHGRRRRTHNRHSREGGNPRRGEPAMGSRLHGNDGGRRRTSHGRRRRTHIVIPATAAGGAPHIVIPATAGIHGGGTLRWVPVYTGTTVGDGAPHTVGERRRPAARARRAPDAR